METAISVETQIKIKKNVWKWTISLVRALFIIGICFVVLYPMFTRITTAFMPAEDMYDATVHYIPKHYLLNNFRDALYLLKWPGSFINTFVLALIVSLVQMFSTTMVGYGFARFRFPGKNLLFLLVILGLIIPPDVMLFPRYLQFRYLDFTLFLGRPFGNSSLLDTMWPQVLLGVTANGFKNGLYVFMMRQFFRGMPKELEEAAYVDGAGSLKTFLKIILPSSIAMMITVFLFSFVWQWLDITYTPIFMQNISLVQTSMNGLIGTITSLGLGSNAELTSSLVKNAGILIIIAPLLVLYIFTQRYFVESIARSGLVG